MEIINRKNLRKIGIERYRGDKEAILEKEQQITFSKF